MEETSEQRAERAYRRAVEDLARVVLMLAEERHDAKGHAGGLKYCEDSVCCVAYATYMAL